MADQPRRFVHSRAVDGQSGHPKPAGARQVVLRFRYRKLCLLRCGGRLLAAGWAHLIVGSAPAEPIREVGKASWKASDHDTNRSWGFSTVTGEKTSGHLSPISR